MKNEERRSRHEPESTHQPPATPYAAVFLESQRRRPTLWEENNISVCGPSYKPHPNAVSNRFVQQNLISGPSTAFHTAARRGVVDGWPTSTKCSVLWQWLDAETYNAQVDSIAREMGLGTTFRIGFIPGVPLTTSVVP